MEVRFIKLRDGAIVPKQAHPGDAGSDLHALEGVVLAPGERAKVPTGIAAAIPEGCAGFLLPRSGLALRHGVTLVNSPGLIDSGYRGELQVLLLNTDRVQDCQINAGERIAQLVLVPYVPAEWILVDEFESTDRGVGGFGSSGS